MLGVSSIGTFELRIAGKDGRGHAQLGVADDGVPLLALDYRDGGVGAVLLAAGAGSSSLHLTGNEGSASLNTTTNVPSELFLSHKDGGLASLKVAADSSPSLYVANKDLKGIATLTVMPDGSPLLGLHDKEGKAGAELIVRSNRSPSLELSDENGMHRAVLGSTALETTRTGTVEQRPPSSLVLFDKDGKVRWATP